MDEKEYKQFVKMYHALKVIKETLPKLSGVTRISVDFACLLATKDALKAHDEDEEGKSTFLEKLSVYLANAQYNVAEILIKQDEKKE